jgi:endothelin-converting enzyme
MAIVCIAGGWLKSHPLPSDKGRFGQFNALSQENLAIILDILNTDRQSSLSIASLEDSADKKLLTKLRNLYSSCMDENTIDTYGDTPLRQVIRVIKQLYRTESTEIKSTDKKSAEERQRDGLTAALAYLHSRGRFLSRALGFIRRLFANRH